MPTLKQINCTIEWESTKVPFKEYGLKYGDGVADCFLVVPETPVAFSVHLKSHGYIAPGLAMFVYMDGIYQCNRNRFNLQIPSHEIPKKLAEIDFRVRQKEETRADGGWIGRSWRFENLHIVNAKSENEPPKDDFDDLGTIQVIVLRCQPRGSGSPTAFMEHLSTTPANSPASVTAARSQGDSKNNFNADIFALDGAMDKPALFALDGPSDSGCGPSRSFGSPGQNQGGQVQGHWGGQQSNNQGWKGSGAQGPYNAPTGSVSNLSYHGPAGGGHQNTPHGSDYGGGGQVPNGWSGPQPSGNQVNPSLWLTQGRPSGIPTPGYSQHAGQNSPINWGGANGGNTKGDWGSGSNHVGSQQGSRNGNAGNNSNQNWGQNGGSNRNNQQNGGGGGGWAPGNGNGNSAWGGSNLGNNTGGPNQQGNSWGNELSSGNNNGQAHGESWGNGGGSKQNGPSDWEKNNSNSIDQGNSTNWNSGNANSISDDQGNSNNWNSGHDNSSKWNSGNENSNPNNQGNSGWGNGNHGGDQSGNNGGNWGSNDNNQDDNTNGYNDTWRNDNNVDNITSGGNDWGGDDADTGNQDSGWDNNNNNNSRSNDWGNKDNNNSGSNNWGNIDNNNSGSNNWDTNDNAKGSGNNHWNRNSSRPLSKAASIAGSRRSSRSAWVTPLTVARQGDEPPMYTVPERVAEELKASHQVQPGQSAPYSHRMSQPSYMDPMRQPYARFIFRYRTKEVIEQELGITIEKDRDEEKRRLATLSKDKVIELLLGAQDANYSPGRTPRPRTPISLFQPAQPEQPETYITPKNVSSFSNPSAASEAPSVAQPDSGADIASKSPILGPRSRETSDASSKAAADPVGGHTTDSRSRRTSTASTKPPGPFDNTATSSTENDKYNDKPTPEPNSESNAPTDSSPITNQPAAPESTPSVRPKSSHGSIASGALDVDALTSKLQDLKTKDEEHGSGSRSRGNSASSDGNSAKGGRARKVSMPGAWNADGTDDSGGGNLRAW